MINAPEIAVTAHEIAEWRAYIGRSLIRRQYLDTASLRRYAVAVGASVEVEKVQPPLAHWAYFLDETAGGQLGVDGHPRRGTGLFPPVRLPRRMFAASSVRNSGPLELDSEAELVQTITDVKHKTGGTGDLVFLELRRELSQYGRLKVEEVQTIVYRNAGGTVPPVLTTAGPGAVEAVEWLPSTVELFRFSAATFNGHRIHYDLPYARQEEGYPGLVVHGPLAATKMHAVAADRGRGPLREFGFRVSAPLFVDQPVRLVHALDECRVEAVRCDGLVAATAKYSVG